jgi:branched-chain amino acid transport system substrate-binding protein
VLANVKDPKVGVLMQNDDYGKDYFGGFKDGMGKDADKIVKLATYEVADPTVDSQIIQLKDSGANVFFNITTPKFAAQAIKKIAEIDWKPMHIVSNVSISVGSVIKPAGFENAQGILSANYGKDSTDPQWDNDPGMKKFLAFLEKYFPEGNKLDSSVVYGYGVAQTMVKVLEMCGDDLTRANVMKQAASLKDFTPDTLLPGVRINTSATDFAPIEQLQMQRFKGEKWELFGDIISGELSN